MTLPAIAAAYCGPRNNKANLTPSQARQFVADKQRERERWVARQMEDF